MGAEIVCICAWWHDFWSWTYPIPIPRLHPPLHFLLTGHLWCCTGGIWQFAWNMAKTETEACSSGSRTNATRQRNCVISRGVACGSNIISICKWRSFINDLPPANLLLHTFTHTHQHTRTLDTLMKFVGAALWRLLFQLINMFVSINRNYANYRWMCFWAPSLACKLHATELSLTCNSMLQACICMYIHMCACESVLQAH